MLKKLSLNLVAVIITFVLCLIVMYNSGIQGKMKGKQSDIRELMLTEIPIGTEWGDVINYLNINNFHEQENLDDVCSSYECIDKECIDLVVCRYFPFWEDYQIAIGFNFVNDRLKDIAIGFFP